MNMLVCAKYTVNHCITMVGKPNHYVVSLRMSSSSFLFM